jgi:hypothetical protein
MTGNNLAADPELWFCRATPLICDEKRAQTQPDSILPMQAPEARALMLL